MRRQFREERAMSIVCDEHRGLVAEAPLPNGRFDESMTGLLHRVRSEFLEMPGLRLTPAQAARLWALDRLTSQRILDGLTLAGFLFRNGNGAYGRASVA
jgi:hypothetical protein